MSDSPLAQVQVVRTEDSRSPTGSERSPSMVPSLNMERSDSGVRLERPGIPRERTWISSFTYAFAGLRHVIKTQRNMRVHILVGAAATALGILLGLEWIQWAVLALTMGFVLVAEMFNTVAEAALDAATPYYHPLVRIAKDVAAGAVLLTAFISVCVGLLVMGPPLWSKIVVWLGH